MSKYTIVKKDDALMAIANELAERNRLKRLELQERMKAPDEGIDWDLSDKA